MLSYITAQRCKDKSGWAIKGVYGVQNILIVPSLNTQNNTPLARKQAKQ